jgi:glycosyltransferase involved in cell wall biosynthesis
VALRHAGIPAFNLCLTPLRIVFDPVYRASYLQGKRLAHRLAVRLGGLGFAALDRIAWRRYRRVFPISREIEQRILAGRLTTPAKMQILHPGIDLDRYTPSSKFEKTFFLPGRIMWTKNIELAIAAFQMFQQRIGEPGWTLKIAGMVDRKSEAYLARLRALAGDTPGIEFCIHPDDEAMRAMYASCHASLFTAFNEDWGLVIIEAMATGKPTIALNRGGPREIIRHEQDGLLIDGTPEAFAAAMLRLAREPGLHQRLVAQTRTSAERFGWPTFVQALDEAVAAGVSPAPSPGVGYLSEVRG